jgi:hypothetical protein
MHKYPTPKSLSDGAPSAQNFLSPRKSWIVIGVVCALSATALLIGWTPVA